MSSNFKADGKLGHSHAGIAELPKLGGPVVSAGQSVNGFPPLPTPPQSKTGILQGQPLAIWDGKR